MTPERINGKAGAQKPRKFNWRGNRPRMGKRSMCPACGFLIHAPAGATCFQCGQRETEDVSYDDSK